MILKPLKLDYNFDVFLNADYSVHYGSCISYQKKEQSDLHEKFGTGFPDSYHEDNTRIQQLWWTDDQIDYKELGNQLGMKVITVSTILQPPGNVVTLHRDMFFQINKQYPNDKRTKVRANIYLEDWKVGHFLQYTDGKKWHSHTDWKQGQGWLWDSEPLHLSANAGLEPKYTLQVSGFYNA